MNSLRKEVKLRERCAVNEAFDRLVISLQYLRNKWVSMEVYSQLIKEYNTDNEVISNLQIKAINAMFVIRHLGEEGRLSDTP